MSRQITLTAWAALLLLPYGSARPADDGPEPDVNLVEKFDGKMSLKWQVLREDVKRHSLKTNKGKLTITTQKGTIHAEADRTAPKAKNLFLLKNPVEKGDFEVSVCVSGFTPAQYYQQGGLICYDDDDNYVKFTYEYNGGMGKPDLVLVREVGAKSQHDRAEAPDGKTVWLRLTRRGEKYEFASSGDGKKWVVHGERVWREKGPPKVGLIAKNGGVDAPEVDVCFESFRLRGLPMAKKEKKAKE
jgi:regulation of enolase protein 1 (concanavalin A-like superfamily)